MSYKLHVQIYPIFLCMLSTAVDRFRLQCNMLCTTCFVDDVILSHNGANGSKSKMTHMSRPVLGGGTDNEV